MYYDPVQLILDLRAIHRYLGRREQVGFFNLQVYQDEWIELRQNERLDLTVSFLREESQGHRLYTFPMSDPTAQHILKLAVGLEDSGININRDVPLL